MSDKIYKKAKSFRDLAKNHHIGSKLNTDIKYLKLRKELNQFSTFKKTDNLLLPPRLIHESKFSLYVQPAQDVYNSPAQENQKVDDISNQVKVSEKQLGVSGKVFEKNLPIPSKSIFVYKIINPKTNKAINKLLEPEIVGLLLRSYIIGKFDENEKRFIRNVLTDKTVEEVRLYQEKALEIFSNFMNCKTLNENIVSEKLSNISDKIRQLQAKYLPMIDTKSIENFLITFNSTKNSPCKLNKGYHQSVILKNKSKIPIKFKIGFKAVKNDSHKLLVSPSGAKILELKKGQTMTLKFSFKALRPVRFVDDLIFLEIQRGPRIYFPVRAYVESKNFGIIPSLLECVEVEGIGKIPKVLEHLKSEIIRRNGLSSEGIFRKAGHETQMQRIKKLLDNENYVLCKNVNNFATLVKIFFRSLPQKIFDFYPLQYFKKMDATKVSVCLDTLNGLPEMSRNLINWLLDFMILVEENSAVNKMTSANLSIVFSPNLYGGTKKARDPATMMIMTSKMSRFFDTILQLRIAQKKGEIIKTKDDDDDDDSGDESEGEYEYYDSDDED